MNLRVRFALALAALAAAATITAGVTSYLSTRDRLNDEVDAALRETASTANRDSRFDRGAPGIDRFGDVKSRGPLPSPTARARASADPGC